MMVTVECCIYWCEQVLDFLHVDKKIIHRDVKPANLLVTSDLQVSVFH